MRSIFAPAVVAEPPTFAANVSPTRVENCLVCHREGGMAPTAVMSCPAVRPRVRVTKDQVRQPGDAARDRYHGGPDPRRGAPGEPRGTAGAAADHRGLQIRSRPPALNGTK